MRLLRVRFTIGRLMIAVLILGVASWILLIARPQIIAERQALASYRQAVLVREVAEFGTKEYGEVIYHQDRATYLGQVALARSDQERAIDRLEWSSQMKEKGRVPLATKSADQLTKLQADFDLEQAQTQLKVLENYTKEKQIKSLKSDADKALAAERSKLATYRWQRSRRWWWVPGS